MQKNKKNSVRYTAGLLLAAGAVMSVNAQEVSQNDIDALKKQIEVLEQNQKNTQQMIKGVGNSGSSPVSFTGFLSIGLSQVSEDDVTYGTGQESDLSLLPTTYAGIQMNADLYEGGEFVYQVVAKGNNGEDDSFDLDTEWLYLKQDLGAGFNMQVGRIRFPAFMDSETYYIGTTYPWVSPPTEIYESLPLTNIDGISVNHNALLGDDWMLSTKVLLWGDASQGSSAYELILDDVYGLSLNLSNDYLNLRLAYMAAEEEIRIDFEGTGNFLDGEKNDLIDDMNETFGDDLEYLIASARYDDGLFYASAEAVNIESDEDLLDENRNWNLTVGMYAGPVLIYVGMSETKVTNADKLTKEVPADSGTYEGTLNDYFNNETIMMWVESEFYTGPAPVEKGTIVAKYLDKQQQTSTIGIKYDFMPNAAFKVQVQKVEDFEGTTGNFAGGTDMTFDDAYIYDMAVQASF